MDEATHTKIEQIANGRRTDEMPDEDILAIIQAVFDDSDFGKTVAEYHARADKHEEELVELGRKADVLGHTLQRTLAKNLDFHKKLETLRSDLLRRINHLEYRKGRVAPWRRGKYDFAINQIQDVLKAIRSDAQIIQCERQGSVEFTSSEGDGGYAILDWQSYDALMDALASGHALLGEWHFRFNPIVQDDPKDTRLYHNTEEWLDNNKL